MSSVQIKQRLFRALPLFLLSAVLISGCYRSSKYGDRRDRYSDNRYEGDSQLISGGMNPLEPHVEVPKLPWESWQLDQDLAGGPISDFSIHRGDQFMRRGDRRSANIEYRKAQRQALRPNEREALILRLASTELALDRPDEALQILSKYFQSQKKVVEDIDARFSLLFGYAYGRRNVGDDLDQSFAWFSRTNRVVAGRGGMADAASSGVRLLLRSLPDGQFYPMSKKWTTDSFVHNLMGQEASRRAGGGKVGDETGFSFGTWSSAGAEIPGQVPPGDAPTLGVMLPLSGSYGPLGRSVKNGVELAVAAYSTLPGLTAVYKDYAGDPLQASALAEELTSLPNSVIVGPLLAEPAEAAATVARRKHVPLISLSKKSFFATGDGIFRLGPTVASQVDSLLKGTVERLGIKRYALVYPDDESGREYADEFRRKINELGLQLVYESPYLSADTSDLVTISESMDINKPEAVFIPDSILAAAKFSAAMSPERRKRMRLLGTAKWDNPRELSQSQGSLLRALYPSPFFSASRKGYVVKFVESYRARFQSPPDFMAAQGFDAATLVLAALERSRSQNMAFDQALLSIPVYEGLTGRISVDYSGDFRRRMTVVEVFEEGLRELPEPETPHYVMRGEHERESKEQTN